MEADLLAAGDGWLHGFRVLRSDASMLFNSGVFLKFFAAFLLLYWLSRGNLKARNVLIVAASYLFYGWWNPSGESTEFGSDGVAQLGAVLWRCRFLLLLVATSLMDFFVGTGLERLTFARHRRLLLCVSIVVNLGVLSWFKYYNFFAESFAALGRTVGLTMGTAPLQIVLPVGISFYTFQSMSYAIDVYRGNVRATRNWIEFLAFVSFFPQLVAGPIERAAHLLPQFGRTLVLTRAMLEEGVWLLIWGMFKKVVIADNLAPLVEMVYDGGTFTGPTVIAGTVAFALQIYCDFSGYSDIARGAARVVGFDIMWNFSLPYAAVNLREFWRRWHVSLSTWLRDYLYISLGGNRRGTMRTYLNLFVTMLLGGLWHGASWHFVVWGAWHGVGLMVHRSPLTHFQIPFLNARCRRGLAWLSTLLFVLYSWLLFRARSLEQVVNMTQALGNGDAPRWMGSFIIDLGAFATPLIAMECWMVRKNNLLAPLSLPTWAKALLQGTLLFAIAVYWQKDKISFIYFQF
jgi:D-alanyl-lipoteichoic acid acyltransferase DltB (MBOAT superfamily)